MIFFLYVQIVMHIHTYIHNLSHTPVQTRPYIHTYIHTYIHIYNMKLNTYNLYIYIYIYIYHHVMPLTRISLTLSCHFSLSFVASGRSSVLHPVSSDSCWMYVRADRPAFARPCVGVHRSISLMSSSMLLQQCPACLVRLT